MSKTKIGEVTDWMRNPAKMFDVSEQTAIVTGASGAFGRGIAITLGAQGANVLLASGNEDELKSVAKDVEDVGGKAAYIVRRPDSLVDAEAMRDAALDNFGSIKNASSWVWL